MTNYNKQYKYLLKQSNHHNKMNLRNGKQIVQQKHQEYQKYQENTNISIVIQENTIQSSKYDGRFLLTCKGR